ncbi:hypothetical protein [Saccharolobus islandicus]|uniref:Uncharacterized protein n=3 Tax=Saccharolobus islandicus TaxID=43080 RepID=C4KK99_SACI6|nr:hypothetical protein [Sulfolobus islandicus]ACP37078.1 conserved hypothetical protein [Sulfolobus islandicus M.14.25]ACP54217.1 conserved hypothetical protein [Sulfolobus islandicus M.16.27]ACR40840.1 conserved hypothetical protein [Sulfolobus islandicus M.16.4]
MSEDEIIDLIFNNQRDIRQGTAIRKENNEVLNKLNEIEKLLQYLIKSKERGVQQNGSLCEQILSSTYVILDENNGDVGGKYFIIDLDSSRKLVTFKDTIELLNFHFSQTVNEQDLDDKLPKRLIPLFRFLRRNGLIYFDYDKKRYFIVDYK